VIEVSRPSRDDLLEFVGGRGGVGGGFSGGAVWFLVFGKGLESKAGAALPLIDLPCLRHEPQFAIREP
jgi:hypothetical protein